MKTYTLQHNVGKAKYVINFHDGIKTHPDGSPFFDIAIFKNRRLFEQFERNLLSLNYIRKPLN